jgi:YfiH family protein
MNDLFKCHATPSWLTPDWPVPATVRSLTTLRTGGVSRSPYDTFNLGSRVGDDPADVERNRAALRSAAGLPADPVWLEQVHGTRVADLDSATLESGAASSPADAAVTRQPGRICAILTADCLPVLLASDSGDRVGAAHAGWRGLAAGVIESTVGALACRPGTPCPPERLLAWLGPAIGPASFEVGPEVREALLAADPGAAGAFAPSRRAGDPPRFLADLYILARRRLTRLGVERVFGGSGCTYLESPRYFSHRRDGRTGRQATLIWLEGAPDR